MYASKAVAQCQGPGSWRKRLVWLAKSTLEMAACAMIAATGDTKAQTATNSVLYWLTPASSYEEGCIPPCLCPDMLPVPVTGTFLLTPAGYDPLYNYYAVTNVNWRVSMNGAEMVVTGSGAYKIGGEVALLQELALDLQLSGTNVERFDSGLVPVAAPFPAIKVTISTTNKICFKAAFNLDAAPAPALEPRVGLAGTNMIVLAWPVSAGPVVLEESSDLSATNWVTVTNTPTVIGQENQVEVSRAPGNRFYRLSPQAGAAKH